MAGYADAIQSRHSPAACGVRDSIPGASLSAATGRLPYRPITYNDEDPFGIIFMVSGPDGKRTEIESHETRLRALPNFIAHHGSKRGEAESIEHWFLRLFRHFHEVGYRHRLYGGNPPAALSQEIDAILLQKFGYRPSPGACPALPAVINAASMAAESEGDTSIPRFLIDNLLPLNEVVILVGAAGSGKSTLLSQLALTVAGWFGGKFLGQAVSKSGPVVVLSTEELARDYHDRVHRQLGASKPDTAFDVRLFDRTYGRQSGLEDILAEIDKGEPPALVIIDSIRSVLGDANENDAGDVTQFLERMYEIATRFDTTVLLVHHVSKHSVINSVKELPRSIRGSQVLVDRPRLLLGMSTDCIKSTLMVIKTNIPQVQQGFNVLMKRDEERLTYVPIDAGVGRDGWTVERAAGVVREVIADANRTGEPIFKSGEKGVFKRADERLAGVGRSVVEKAVSSLIDDGHLTADKVDGLVVS